MTLTHGEADTPTAADVHAILPFAAISAFESARAAGFQGSADEYYSGLAALPALSASLTDFAAGKEAVAAALAVQGVDIAPTAALSDMATAVRGLHLAVPGQEGIVDQTDGGRNPLCPDLLNALRNNRRTDLPYSWGAVVWKDTVTLSGADAYLCSDGHFTTEGGTHTFADSTPGAGHWIIYYYATRHFNVTNTTGASLGDVTVLNGTPDYSVATTGAVRSFTDDLPDDGEATSVVITAATAIELRGVRRLASGSAVASGNGNLRALSLPQLEEWGGGQYLVSNCAALCKLNLSGVETWGFGYLSNGTTRIESVYFGSLRTVTSTGVNNGILFNFKNETGTVHLYFPALVESTGHLGFRNALEAHIHLGTQQGETIRNLSDQDGSFFKYKHLHVGKGFRSAIMTAYTFAGTTRDELLEIIDNLADNNAYDTLNLNFGATLLALLTDDEIAAATDKNYTLS